MKIILPLITPLSLLILSSCSILSKGVEKEIKVENFDELSSVSPPYKLSYACNCENSSDEGFLSLETPALKSNIYSQTIIKVERQGYIPQYIDVPKRFSPYAAADIITGGAILATTAYLITVTFNEPFVEEAYIKKIFTGATGGVLSYMAIGNGILASKINVKKMQVNPDLTPFPERKDSSKFVEIKNLNLSLDEYSYIRYKNIKKFHKDKKYKSSNKKIDQLDFQANFVLNKFLVKSGFVDTVNVVKSRNNTVILDARISEFLIHKINEEDLASFEFTIEWTFKDMLSKEVLQKETTNYKSHLLVYRNDFNPDYFENIIINSFDDLMKRKGISKILKIESESNDSYADVLSIRKSTYSKNLTEATQSSVTVKSGESFKSGVVISSDGYILTELGNLQSKKEQIEILFPDNTSADGDLVRYNRKYNIALIKVSKDSLTSVELLEKSEFQNIKTGQRVFSVGVAGDLRLGQSLSNGVISGVRNINGEKYIQTDLKMSNVSIGSPILNENRKVIGIMTSNKLNSQVEGINFAIPIDVIQENLNIYIQE